MSFTLESRRRVLIAAALAILLGALAGSLRAQELATVLVLIDKDSITHGQLPNGFTTQDVNEELASVGMRDNLPYFKRNIGKNVTLVTGRGSNDGWHTLAAVPPTWATEAGENDGLENFVLAGPGLGSPDASGARTSLLMGAIVKGLRGSDLTALQGRSVCAVVFQSDLGATALPVDLNGPTIGIIALKIVSASASSDASGIVEATILDAADVCQGALALPGGSSGS